MMSYNKYGFFLLFVLADLTVSHKAQANHMLIYTIATCTQPCGRFHFNEHRTNYIFNQKKNYIAVAIMSYSSRSTINICIHIIAKAAL